MDWTQAIDIYCERTTPAFWSEPFNAISNLSFLLAALWAAIEGRRRAVTDWVTWLLIGMAALIGLGSFLFHTFANLWSVFADTLPIWSFVAVFVVVAMRRIGGMRPGRIAAVVLGVAALAAIFILTADETAAPVTTPDPLNGSGQYAPAVIALLAFAIISQWRKHPMRHWIVAAAAVFLVSLTFRTVDIALCAAWPYGTHFAWHILNGLMIGLLLQVLVRNPHTPTPE